MSEHAILLKKTSLRKFCRSLDLNEVLKLQANLDLIATELTEEAELAELEEVARQERIQELLSLATEHGISLSDLASDAVPAKKKANVPAKYHFVDASNEEHFWSGRGRTPNVFKELKEIHGSLDDYLI